MVSSFHISGRHLAESVYVCGFVPNRAAGIQTCAFSDVIIVSVLHLAVVFESFTIELGCKLL